AAIDASPRLRSVRTVLSQMDMATQWHVMRVLAARPDVVIGSVHAITEQGEVVVASASGSQLGPYASGAGKVIWVVGSQKIVPSLDEAMRRIREYALPLEDERAQLAYGQGSFIGKELIFYREYLADRDTEHPHRGFDNLWYILKGDSSTGHTTGPGGSIERADLPEGSLLFLRTGRGARHAERVGGDQLLKGLDEEVRTVLFWVNL